MNFFKTFLAALLAFVAGGCVMCILWFFMLFMAIGIVGAGESKVRIGKNSVLVVDFAETIVDAPSSDPLDGFDFVTLQTEKRLPLLRVLRALEAAAEDPRIEGVYLRMNGGGGVDGAALLEELRAALDDFKRSGKFVVAYNEVYTQGGYYLASVADAVYMQPEGGLDWSGLAFDMMFYKGLFDKLDLKAEVFRPTACKYKSAVEPYIADRMSPANREQMQAVVDSMWETIAGAVAEARGMDPEELRRITDNLEALLPEEALAHGFVDGLIYEDEMEDVFAELNDDGADYDFVTLGDYAAQTGFDLKRVSSPQVAVVYADGTIVDGEGYGREIYGNTLAQTLADVREDDRVKSVVLRVNSPGGSALASDVIWREVELLREEKPVIVSMGAYAASGGYYISCPADAIVADRMTLTGSIGVFGIFINPIDALRNKLGITLDGVKSNKSAGMGAVEPLTPLERAAIMRGVDKVYDTFTSHVAEGRNLPVEQVLEIAGGRVWTGEAAVKIGLVDGCGGLREAIAVAADKAGLGDDFRVKEVLDEPTGLAAFFAALETGVRARMLCSELWELSGYYTDVREAVRQRGLTMYCPYRTELE